MAQARNSNNPDDVMRLGELGVEARAAATREAQAKLDAGEMPVFHGDTSTEVITPSAKEAGRFQVTTYTEQGAMGDSQYDTLEDAINAISIHSKRLLTRDEARKAMADRLEQENAYQSKKARVESGPRVDDTVYVTEADGTVGEYTYRGKDGEGNAMVVKGMTQKSVPMANVQMEQPNVQQQPAIQTEAPAQGQPAQAEGVAQQKTPKQPEAEGGRVEASVAQPNQPNPQVDNVQSERPQAPSGAQTQAYDDTAQRVQGEATAAAAGPATGAAQAAEPGAVAGSTGQQGGVAETQAQYAPPAATQPQVPSDQELSAPIEYKGAKRKKISLEVDGKPEQITALPYIRDLDSRLSKLAKVVRCLGR
jgi:hypothetical protein